MRFIKMHGLGNDYVFVDCFQESLAGVDPAALARRVSDRHFGIGGDGLVLILPAEAAAAKMRIFNADGSEAEMCGNAIRCVGKYLYESGRVRRNPLEVETLAGVKTLALQCEGEKVAAVRVDMGRPRFRAGEIPLTGDPEAVWQGKEITVAGETYPIVAVSMGNPHCVIFVDEVATWPVERLGPLFERHELFPARTNVEFVEVKDRRRLQMRVWERGSGETMACGTGACAAGVAAMVMGKSERRVTVSLPGGDLVIEWAEDDHVFMTGPAVEVFRGEMPL